VIDTGGGFHHLARLMSRLAVCLLMLAATLPARGGAPQIALVRVMDIYGNLASTAELRRKYQSERDAIMRDPRAEILRSAISGLEGELEEMRKRLRDKTRPLDEESARKLFRMYEIKRQEAGTLQDDFEKFRSEREKDINRRMIAAMRESLDRIMEAAGRTARVHGCGLVIDSTGNTNTGVPFILYQKNAKDLTDAVKTALGEDAAPTTTDNHTPAPN
jgi:Skp family chaperone for outer membrane proteins